MVLGLISWILGWFSIGETTREKHETKHKGSLGEGGKESRRRIKDNGNQKTKIN